MNLQETIRRVLREELSPRIRRRLSNDEMENEFLESFEGAYRLTKNRKVLSSHFLDELLYTTITFMMDGVHWRFVSTLPEDEFWYDDIHKELENYYRDRIMQMYNERKGIKESILREYLIESDPKVGTGKKPKGSDRRLYTDENPKDTVSVKFRTKQDIVDTLNKESFKSKSHARQSQIINLIHQRLIVALERAKDPEVKKRLKTAFEYIETKKEQSKKKTQEMKEGELTEKCWAGYTQKGMKTMFGKRYPNCVKKKKK
jgi:hypothetical protein